jgi:hypothetical protein
MIVEKALERLHQLGVRRAVGEHAEVGIAGARSTCASIHAACAVSITSPRRVDEGCEGSAS